MAFAQPGDDDVEYYTDSRVKHSRWSIAANLYPNYTDRRLINNEVPSGGGFNLPNEDAQGAFQLNYGLDFFYSIGSAFDVGIGIGRAAGNFSVDNVMLYQGRTDTTLAKMEVGVSMYTVPLKLNFNTAITDILDLEVVPTVELNFVDKYDQTFTPRNENSFTNNLKDRTQSTNWSVGIGLGGTFNVTEEWGVIVRGNIKYMLNPLIEADNFPRETLISYGAVVGLKYKF
ncbi:MAG: hypothetical protein CMI36_14050 [Owenweeksia sp.]|nr:hypothetical protein [Owenweeksia sp.]MBG00114.1 hypothetical protein [Owenweeksia sp.]HBF19379.1 hypothetical protein [Cryomorphaceae bacterium]